MALERRRILIIDGAHYDRIRTALDARLNFTRLVELLSADGPVTHAQYHRDLRDTDERDRQRPLLSWLAEHGLWSRAMAFPLMAQRPGNATGPTLSAWRSRLSNWRGRATI